MLLKKPLVPFLEENLSLRKQKRSPEAVPHKDVLEATAPQMPIGTEAKAAAQIQDKEADSVAQEAIGLMADLQETALPLKSLHSPPSWTYFA